MPSLIEKVRRSTFYVLPAQAVCLTTPCGAGLADRGAFRLFAIEGGQRREELLHVSGSNEAPCFSILDQLGYGGNPGRKAGEFLALGFHEHVGEAIAVATFGDAARQHKNVGLAVGGQDNPLRLGAAPFDSPAQSKAAGPCLEVAEAFAAADVDKPPIEIIRELP